LDPIPHGHESDGQGVISGKPFSYGLDLPRLDTEIQLGSLSIPGLPPSARIVGTGFIESTENNGGIGTSRRYPPHGYVIHPVKGTNYGGPGSTGGGQVLVGLVVDGNRPVVIDGFTLGYQSDGHAYTWVFPQTLRVCPGKSTAPADCSPPQTSTGPPA